MAALTTEKFLSLAGGALGILICAAVPAAIILISGFWAFVCAAVLGGAAGSLAVIIYRSFWREQTVQFSIFKGALAGVVGAAAGGAVCALVAFIISAGTISGNPELRRLPTREAAETARVLWFAFLALSVFLGVLFAAAGSAGSIAAAFLFARRKTTIQNNSGAL